MVLIARIGVIFRRSQWLVYSTAPNLIPGLNIALFVAIQANDLARATAVFCQQVDKGLPRAIKAGQNLLGEDGGGLRNPLKPLTDREVQELAGILSKLPAGS